MAKKLQTEVVLKSQSDFEERQFVNPPRCVFLLPHLEQSQNIVMEVGSLRQMLEGLDDKDSFRIEWHAHKATEYSYISHDKKRV